MPTIVSSRLTALCAIVLALCMAAGPAHAAEVGYKDHDGRWRVIDTDDWPRHKDADKGRFVYKQTGGINFTVTYLDIVMDTNVGFDDPVNGPAYRAITESVFNYLNQVFDATGSCDVEFDASQTDGTGSLASAGTFYFTNPGFKNGFAFSHIMTGADPIPSFPDITAQVDFGYDWHASESLPIADDTFDFFSVILHELTHGLGITGLSNITGESDIAPGVYSVFDDFLYTGNGVKLWNASGQFQSTVAALTGGDGGVFYRGPNAVAEFGGFIPIFAPDPYTTGSSIAHWAETLMPEPVMDPNIFVTQDKRAFIAFELEAFRDLGYSLAQNAARRWTVFE